MYPYGSLTLNEIADWSQIVGIAAAVIVLLLARRQLIAATSAAEAEALMALDQAFFQFEGLRNKLRNASPESPYEATKPEDKATLSRYLVVFERLGLLVDKRLIKKQRAIDLYGYALSRLLKRSNAQEIVLEEIEEAREAGSGHSDKRWESLIPLWQALPDGPKVPEDIARADRAQRLGRLRRIANRS